MLAPERFAGWLAANTHVDRKWGHTYLYHSRSDAHSVALCQFIWDDLVAASKLLRAHVRQRKAAYGINTRVRFPNGKEKALDLAVGIPANEEAVEAGPALARGGRISRLLISCEAKAVMTEHSKSKPRVYNELSSSHEIVHQGQPDAIATGFCVVNMAGEFVSPLRQNATGELIITRHDQPRVTTAMAQHLRGLPIRDSVGSVGFNAYTTVVIATDNRAGASLVTSPPAPQRGDRDHYETFLDRISCLYAERFPEI